MEFFQELRLPALDVGVLQDSLRIATLPDHCASIDRVMSDQGDRGEIYCLWGQFRVSREPICKGVRFSLLNCPHALAWTVAYHAWREKLVIHCTIDDRETDPEFAESIEQFLSDWSAGLGRAFGGPACS